MKIVNGMTIEATETDFGVEYENLTYGGTMQMPCSDELEAYLYADHLNGKVVQRAIFVTGWVKVESISGD